MKQPLFFFLASTKRLYSYSIPGSWLPIDSIYAAARTFRRRPAHAPAPPRSRSRQMRTNATAIAVGVLVTGLCLLLLNAHTRASNLQALLDAAQQVRRHALCCI